MGPMQAPWRSAAAQVLVADLARPELDPDAAHHLGRVLRLRDGAEVCAADGRGGWRRCRLVLAGRGAAELVPEGEVQREPAPDHEVAVGVALVKSGKPELVVQKLTELGVDRIAVFAARRSVVRWDEERGVKHLERLAKVAVEACAQCRRLWLPTVELARFDDLLAQGAVVAEAGGRPLRAGDRKVLVGPEGGWADEELTGPGGAVDRVALGEHVLRAETAAITAGALLTALRAGLVADSPG